MPDTLWTAILSHIQAISPLTLQTLNPPATLAQIAELEEILGVTLPEDFKQYLCIFNGQQPAGCIFSAYHEALPLLSYQYMLGTAQIIETARMMQTLFADEEPIGHIEERKIKPYVWHPHWVPFADFEASERYVLDLAPGVHGYAGQVFVYGGGMDYGDDDTVIANSFGDFSARVLDALKQERYTLDGHVIALELQ